MNHERCLRIHSTIRTHDLTSLPAFCFTALASLHETTQEELRPVASFAAGLTIEFKYAIDGGFGYTLPFPSQISCAIVVEAALMKMEVTGRANEEDTTVQQL